MRMITAGG
ncbi:hypothetical protein EYF80_066433 [Liparis tanakae]|uniref:Uncharacterized protein n=1 Tax=Liparis tanakae TaxID=230148 RepID=A0A4Z2E3E4_9TELE|nr:hypothetical protein EYF80_066433 [Liparis tanakae]